MHTVRSSLRPALLAVLAAALLTAVAAGPAAAAGPPAPPSLAKGPRAKSAAPRSATRSLLAATQYEITSHTGNVSGAGTDGDVWVWVDGTLGRSGWLYLDNPEDNFERNKTDYFHFTLSNLGTLTRAYVYFRPGGFWPDWYLDTVAVNGTVFPVYRWFTSEGYVGFSPA